MTRTMIGLDYEGVAAVKITKDNYDPVNTSDALRERFYFNSKWTNQLTTPEIQEAPYVSYGGTERAVFFPSGSNRNTFATMRVDQGTLSANVYTIKVKVAFPDIRYDLPMFELIPKNISNGRYAGVNMRDYEFGSAYGPGGVYGGYTGFGDRGVLYRQTQVFDDVSAITVNYATNFTIRNSIGLDYTAIFYNLPGNNVALDGPTSPPSPVGKRTVQITSDYCRVAKPGYDVATATPAQLAFDSTGRPLNVVAAADIAIPVGASSYDTGITLPANVAIDMSLYNSTGTFIHYPMRLSDSNSNYGVEYWTDGTLIRFNNTKSACRARFIVFAADTLGPTSGTNNVLRQFTANGEVVAQFLRPGAGSTPRFSDIILDSRRPVIQIIANGYFSVPAQSGTIGAPTETIVNYDATGFFPYVKFMTVHGSGLNEEVRYPRVNRRFGNSLSTDGLSGDGSYCRYDQGTARFYTARGRPRYTFYRSSGGGEIVNEMDANPMVGIRWYVLGIPTP